ncbi:MAG: Ig-like domain-containing protein, partial [Chloroflexota bacterium]
DSNIATYDITVTPVNDAPVANDDSATTLAGAPHTFPASGPTSLKGNDTDVDNTNSQLFLTGVTDPPHGTATLNPDGSVTYTPDAFYIGSDQFDYTVCDPGQDGSAATTGDNLCDTGTVTMTVNPGDLTVGGVVTDADFRQMNGFDVLFTKGGTNTTLKLKNTNPGTMHYQLTLTNTTGVPIDSASGNVATVVLTVPGMPLGANGCGVGISCSPAVTAGLADPAFFLKGEQAVKAHPDDRSDDMQVSIRYKDLTGYITAGNSCDSPVGWTSTLPAGGAAKCIEISGFSIPTNRSATVDIHFEFRPKNTDGWASNAQLYFRAGFAFRSTARVTFPAVPTVRTSNQVVGIVGAGQKVTAIGGFVYDAVGMPAPAGTTVEVFDNSTPPACGGTYVARDTVSTDGFYFIWKKGSVQSNASALDLPSGIQYTVKVCSGAAELASTMLQNKLTSKEFREVNFRLP